MAKRIFITGFWHETNTFAPTRTGLDDFHAYQYAEGDVLFEAFADTNTEIGGVMNAAMELDLNLIPGLFAGAVPSGMIKREAYQTILDRTLELLEDVGEIDGMLVHVHGAAVAEGAPEADADYLFALRRRLPLVPIVATFDLHANMSDGLVAAVDGLIGYNTYPHNDMAERGTEAAHMLHRMLWSDKRPEKIFVKLPFAPPPQVQATADQPVAGIMAKLEDMKDWGGIWSGSIAWGFPYADVAHLGVGILVQGDDIHHCRRIVDDLALTIWHKRGEFDAGLIEPEEAVRNAMAAPDGPIILADVADNAGVDVLAKLSNQELLRLALEALNEQYREPFLLVFLEDFTCRETAELLSIPLGTVLSRIHRARQFLRRFLRQLDAADEPQAARTHGQHEGKGSL